MSGTQANGTTTPRGQASGDDIDDDRTELLVAIQRQGAQTLELVRAILNLLLPKEGGREGPSLEQLLAALVAQQREALLIAQVTQADLARLGETLPEAVAEAVGERSPQNGARRPS